MDKEKPEMEQGGDTEYLDVVDENGQPVGQSVPRSLAHREGLAHRTTHLWLVRPSDKGWDILMQKRSMEKETFPGLYDTSSAGHVPAGTEPLPSALRELSEELGIEAQPEDLRFAGTFRTRYEEEFHARLIRDDEFAFVFVCTRPVDIAALTLQASEVDEVRWFDLNTVWEEVQRSRERFCVPIECLDVLRHFLERKAEP